MPEQKEGPLVTPKERHWLSEALMANPILVQAVGLAPVVAVATSLRAALLITLVGTAHLFVSEILTSLALRKLPGWLRVACYFALGLGLVVPLLLFLRRAGDPLVAAMDVFLPLMALNSVTAIRCEHFAVIHNVPACLRDAAANAIGYGAVACLVGLIREILGNGSVWGRHIMGLRLRGLWMPLGGFLVIGMLAAGLKLLLRTLSEHGIVIGAHKAMELEPEDRQARREKTRKLFEDEESRNRVLRAAGALPAEKPPPERPRPVPAEAAEAEGKKTPKPPHPPLRELEERVLGSLNAADAGSPAAVEAALAALDELKALEAFELSIQEDGKGSK